MIPCTIDICKLTCDLLSTLLAQHNVKPFVCVMEGGGNQNVVNMEWDPVPQPRNEHGQPHVPANIEEDRQIPRNADGSLDGGAAVPPESSKTMATECDLVRKIWYISTWVFQRISKSHTLDFRRCYS
jgi:hypothetical protein